MTFAATVEFKPLPSLTNWLDRLRETMAAPADQAEAAVARLDRDFEKVRRERDDGAEGLRKAMDDLRQRASDGEAVSIDAHIETVERAEEEAKAQFRQVERMLRLAERQVRRSPRLQAVFGPRLARARQASQDDLRALQDVKWQLMAIRSSVETDREGPTFDDAKDLKRYLSNLGD